MDFWLLDVKSTMIVSENTVAFDYINTYFEVHEAIKEAKFLSLDENVLEVSVHHWILREDGKQEHVEEEYGRDVLYHFSNEKHRELGAHYV